MPQTISFSRSLAILYHQIQYPSVKLLLPVRYISTHNASDVCDIVPLGGYVFMLQHRFNISCNPHILMYNF